MRVTGPRPANRERVAIMAGQKESETCRTWRIVLKLLSPMQIGAGQLGMVERTELYIPGRVVWGAITATVTAQMSTIPQDSDYKSIGQQLGDPVIDFGCFFPSFDQGTSFYYPIHTGSDVQWLNNRQTSATLSNESIAARMLFSVCSTAIDPFRMASMDSMLHATDMIAPAWFDKGLRKCQPICFVGEVTVPESLEAYGRSFLLDQRSIASVLNRCRLGGGRKRGWGIISVVDAECLEPSDRLASRWIGHDNGYVLLSPCPVREGDGCVQGVAKLAVYREHCSRKGFGQALSKPELMWQPGAIMPGDWACAKKNGESCH
jgi:hypothetical protein